MFKVEKTSPNLLNVEIGGSITASEMSEGLDKLLPMMREMSDGRMMMVYGDIGLPEAGAIMEEMKRLPQLFGVIGHVNKVALISGQKWVRDMAELEGMVIPGVTIRSFEPDARDAAEEFLEMETGASPGENFPV